MLVYALACLYVYELVQVKRRNVIESLKGFIVYKSSFMLIENAVLFKNRETTFNIHVLIDYTVRKSIMLRSNPEKDKLVVGWEC